MSTPNDRPLMESKCQALTLSWTEDGLALITLDVKDKSVNAFSLPILESFGTMLDTIFATPALRGIVIASGKKGSFAAGVDISIFETLKTSGDGQKAARDLQLLFGRLEGARVPVAVAIDGICLGGGFELALACHYRILSNSKETKLGLPEVQIGLLPGGGGTQRLPRLIGLAESLPLILTGKQIDSRKALKLGIADAVVPPNQMLEMAMFFCREKKPRVRKSSASVFSELAAHKHLDVNKIALEGNAMGRSLIRKKSLEQIHKSTKGRYPAPLKALESVLDGITRPFEQGLENEARLFGELVTSPESRSLVHIFEIMTAAKKNPVEETARNQARQSFIEPLVKGSKAVGILGAGLMGSGIATVLAEKSVRTILFDKDAAGVGRGLSAIGKHFDDKMKKKRIKSFEHKAATSHVCPSLDLKALRASGVIVEAVFEDLGVKHKILRQCEEVCASGFIFATNTSSIPITDIAQGARNPENVIGMHFFSPVPKMPLVEIIKTTKTSPETLSATFDLASKMGKNIIVVNDGPGFYTTRILAFYIAEALSILTEGASIEDIDAALESFGMPVGPITLLDEVGIDVGGHIIKVLKSAFADRLKVPAEIAAIEAENRKGRKNDFGFYRYDEGKKSGVDATIYKHLRHGTERQRFDRKHIADRCVFVFLNEAARCLDEGIIQSADDGDLGAVFGLGFPPFLGGPFHYARSLGAESVRARLTELAAQLGERFTPASFWSNEKQTHAS